MSSRITPPFRPQIDTPAPVELDQAPGNVDFCKFAAQLSQDRFAQVFPFFFLVGQDERIKPRSTVQTAVVDVATLPKMKSPQNLNDVRTKPPLVLPCERAHNG